MRLLLLLSAVALAAPASAQTFISGHGGGVDFDLAGTGQTAVFELRIGRFMSRYVALEGGLGVSDVPEQFGGVFYVLPSLEVQFGVPIRDRVRPYVGVGVGSLLPIGDPRPGLDELQRPGFRVDYDPPSRASINVGVGADLGIAPDLAARFSGRLRATGRNVTEFSGTFSEVTLGIGVRL